MEEKIIRPTTKPEAIKGKLLKYQGTDCCEFMPQAQGEPQYGHKRKVNIHVFYTNNLLCMHYFCTFATKLYNTNDYEQETDDCSDAVPDGSDE